MLRLEVVRSILFDQVAGLQTDSSTEPEVALAKARRRAAAVAILDWAAILALFLLRDAGTPLLVLGASQQGVFTLGILAVASHAGFRLGQLDKLAAVGRVLEQLPDSGRAAAADPEC
jgi:hypothetical protein